MIETYLLTLADIERRFLKTNDLTDELITKVGICPVIELFELCESVKKRKTKLDGHQFNLGINALQEGPVIRGEVIIVTLDQERLADALFERNRQIVTGLWLPAVDRNISPSHSIRRLLLRPSNQTWWNGDIYSEAEENYGNTEMSANV